MKEDIQNGTLFFEWRLGSFFQNLQDDLASNVICEEVKLSDIKYFKEVDDYWSVPERLVDMRWICGNIKEVLNTPIFDNFIEVEYGFYRIVTTLSKWGVKCQKQSTEEQNHQFWEENRDLITRYAGNEAQIDLNTAAADFLHIAKSALTLRVADTRKRAFITEAQQLKKLIVNMYGENPLQPSFNNLIDSDEQVVNEKNLKEAISLFCKKANDFFTNTIWRGESSGFRKIGTGIRNIVKKWNIEEAEIIDVDDQDSVWKALQKVAYHICNQINETASKSGDSIDGLMESVERIWKDLSDEKMHEVKNLNAYKKDGRRCVAVFNVNAKKYIAFSGYLDWQDPQTLKAMCRNTTNDNTIKLFTRVARENDAQLVIFSSDVVDNIVSYELEKNCRLENQGTLRMALQEIAKKTADDIDRIKGSFSCCERKILSQLEIENTTPTGNINIIVKFCPCMKCYGAIRSWLTSKGINATIDYPGVK